MPKDVVQISQDVCCFSRREEGEKRLRGECVRGKRLQEETRGEGEGGEGEEVAGEERNRIGMNGEEWIGKSY